MNLCVHSCLCRLRPHVVSAAHSDKGYTAPGEHRTAGFGIHVSGGSEGLRVESDDQKVYLQALGGCCQCVMGEGSRNVEAPSYSRTIPVKTNTIEEVKSRTLALRMHGEGVKATKTRKIDISYIIPCFLYIELNQSHHPLHLISSHTLSVLPVTFHPFLEKKVRTQIP